MSEHKPECPANWGVGEMPDGPCTFCEMLRACEQRCDEKRHAEVRAWSELSRDNFDHGFTAGLNAAREAVAALTTDLALSDQDTVVYRADVIAAIDALRGKP